MKHGYVVFDSDLHVIEPADLWTERIDPRFRGRVTGHARFAQDVLLEIDGEPVPRMSEAQLRAYTRKKEAACVRYADAAARGYDAASHLRAMDEEGVDLTVLFPTRGFYSIAPEDMDPQLALAISRAYNDWLAEYCAADPRRLMGAAMVPPQDPELAAREIRRVMKEHAAFRAAYLRPNPIRDTYWHHARYDVLWAELQELNIPVCFHEGGPPLTGIVRQAGADRLDLLQMAHCFSHPGEMMLACIAFCMGGVLERFPRLRVAFLEGGCSWAPWLTWRMDEHVETMPAEDHAPKLSLLPSAYFRRQCFVSVECDEHPGRAALEAFDGECILFSTDYPHIDSKYPHAVDSLFDNFKLPPAHWRKVLSESCARLYDVDLSVLTPRDGASRG